ncbi:MAG TPA: isoprenylcysteine carboxylmethyltransferase family protein [Alphaproteobacteria bacterium]|jgi:protein-S-isoprenylcysteine O-methyltransferase Ste14|nr:isoprenylcysteine carboxylmethyltransferase family protein [Alphaproteobacteria bacterium]
MLDGLLIPLLWLAWLIYWYWPGRAAKPVMRRESSVSGAAHIVPLSLAIALFAFYGIWPGWLTAPLVPRSLAEYWAGIAILVAGLGFSIAARRYLGANWSGTVTVKQNHELIRTGPYAIVRHPIYTGMLVGFIGSAISLDEVRGLVAIALVVVAFLLKIRLEERWMTEIFGDAYRRYRAEVKALIPFVV